MLTPLPSSSTLATVAPAPSASHPVNANASASASAGAGAGAGAGAETGTRTAETRSGFARALEQAAASDAAKEAGPTDRAAQAQAQAQATADGAPKEMPTRSNGAASAAQKRAAMGARLEPGRTPTAPPSAGAKPGPSPALDNPTADPASTAQAAAVDGTDADGAAPEVGAIGALLSQLQAAAAAAHQPAAAAGAAAAAPTAQARAGLVNADTPAFDTPTPAPDGPGARRASALARSEAARQTATTRQDEPLNSSAAWASPTASTPLQPAGNVERAGSALLAVERPIAEGSQLLPMQASASAGLGPHNAPAMASSAGSNTAAGEARLSASPGSPEFGPQLGAQITTFIRDGLENARLQLHPADMGPVLVQIQLDGQTAQVHLSAEHAVTRQALEDALPQLASQLREAGLTLSGGGVSEQAQQGRQAPSNRAADRSSPSDSTGGAAEAAAQELRQPATRRGVVDLVA